MSAVTLLAARAAAISGVTSHRICKNITLFLNESPSPPNRTPIPVDTKPLLLLLPWLGSRPKAMARYCEVYFRSGFDVLVVESEVTGFVWPRWGLEYGGRVLELLHDERFVSRPLLVHAFSLGGYTFAQLLVHVSQDTEKYQALTGRIRGQIYDSLVIGSLERMAIGLGKNVFPRWENLVKRASLLYFTAFKHQTVAYFDRAIDVFRDTPLSAPALFFYCENDALSDPLALEDVVHLWQKRGMDVTAKKWEDSTHAGHLRRHPQEYLATLDAFLQSLSLAPLKAKM